MNIVNIALETKSCGCLLCGRYFKNEHGVSIHVGKTHNNPKIRPAETRNKP